MSELNDYVQLHEHIEIHYYVDHWAAEYYIWDGNVSPVRGRGSSIEEALKDLTCKLKTKTLQEWRKNDN